MKAQQENLILFFMLVNQKRDVQRTFMENFKMRMFNYIGDQNNQPGPHGIKGIQVQVSRKHLVETMMWKTKN